MTPSLLTTRYDAAAPDWECRIAKIGYFGAYRSLFSAFGSNLNRTSRVCDVGTGSGTFARAVLSNEVKPAKLTLVDPSRAMLQLARKTLSDHAMTLRTHARRIEEFHPHQSFDLILGAHVLEHCPNATNVLAQLFGMLAPGGDLILVISKPHWCQWLIWLRWRHRWYSESAVRELAGHAGLPPPICHQFTAGPPQRTSLGYCFHKSDQMT